MGWLLLVLCCGHVVYAQEARHYTVRDYARKPLWGQLMDDTLSNFHEVELAFNTYFKHHELPEEEHDVIGEHAEREKKLSKRKQRKVWRENDLRMEVRRYEFCHNQTLPYVQPDGRILTPTERLAIWQKQQQPVK